MIGFLTVPAIFCVPRARHRQPGLISILLPTTNKAWKWSLKQPLWFCGMLHCRYKQLRCFLRIIFFPYKNIFNLDFNSSIISTVKKSQHKDIFLFASAKVLHKVLQSFFFSVFRDIETLYEFLLAFSRFSLFFHSLAQASYVYLKLGILITV